MPNCVIVRGDVVDVVNSDSNDVNTVLPGCRCERMIYETCPCYPDVCVLCPGRVKVSTRILVCSLCEEDWNCGDAGSQALIKNQQRVQAICANLGCGLFNFRETSTNTWTCGHASGRFRRDATSLINEINNEFKSQGLQKNRMHRAIT